MFWFDIFLIADFHEQTVYLWQIWTAEPSNAKTDGKLPLYTSTIAKYHDDVQSHLDLKQLENIDCVINIQTSGIRT